MAKTEKAPEPVVTETPTDAPQNTAVPPFPLVRNGFGLLPNVNYIFDEDGYVDWRKMIDPKFLVPNKEVTDETDITKLEDNQLIILLGGIKKLARVRGFEFVKHRPIVTTPQYVAVETTIGWSANYETGYKSVEFSVLADASLNNTNSFSSNYLAAIAENRGFVRAVRNFLNINIVGKEELGAKGEQTQGGSENSSASAGGSEKTREVLSKLLKLNEIKFESFKNQMIKEEIAGADDWENLESISEDLLFDLISKTQDLIAKRNEILKKQPATQKQ